MKYLFNTLTIMLLATLMSCGGGDEKKDKKQVKIGGANKEVVKKKKAASGAVIDMSNKGVGPVKNLDLPETIDQTMVAAGAELFKTKCSACHKVDKKFIGPAPTGVMERRSPEWIMNMILDPEGMVQNDPIAKALLIEYNGSPMANQSLTETEARSILEYFRTLK
jgi:mono/diheme cytochrome c family protein